MNMGLRATRCHARFGTHRCILQAGHPEPHQAASHKWLSKPETDDAGVERELRIHKLLIESRLAKAETRHEPFKSWRWWELSPRGKLMSITADYIWGGPTATTRQLPDGSLALVSAKNHFVRFDGFDDYGVYSYKTPSLLFTYNPSLQDRASRNRIIVLGELENWGHVVEHAYGYRSQRVLITKLWVFAPYLHGVIGMDVKMNIWKGLLESTYQCDVEIVENQRLEGWIKYYSDTHQEEPSNE